MVRASWVEEGRRTRVEGWKAVVVGRVTVRVRERNIVGGFGSGWERWGWNGD